MVKSLELEASSPSPERREHHSQTPLEAIVMPLDSGSRQEPRNRAPGLPGGVRSGRRWKAKVDSPEKTSKHTAHCDVRWPVKLVLSRPLKRPVLRSVDLLLRIVCGELTGIIAGHRFSYRRMTTIR